MSRRQANICVALLLLVAAGSAYHFPQVRAAVTASAPVAWLLSSPDPMVAADRSEQTDRGWRAVPTPYPTPRATPVKPAKHTPEPTNRPAIVQATVQSAGASLVWPIRGPLTTYFSAAHPAIDISAPLGTPVKAACSGKVIYAAWKTNGGGNVVDIACSNGLTVSNNHLSAIAVAVGQAVGQGAIVGLVGMTGNATGPHCHFAVISHGQFVNPLLYLP
jgi:murein DD-endopeptidase MepM/ murein hydrolase activator NlpD